MVIVAPMEQECAGLMSLMTEAFQFLGTRKARAMPGARR
jgi:hypothetical protein